MLILTALLAFSFAAAQAADQTTQLIIPLVVGDANHGTGIAVSNSGGTAANLTFEFYSPTGERLAGPAGWNSSGPTDGPGPLLAGEQRALTDWEIFGLPAAQERRGWVLIRSDSPDIRAVYQFFSNQLDELDGMNALQKPATRFFLPWILHGSKAHRGFDATTEISILNPGDAPVTAALTLSGLEGEALAKVEKSIPGKGMLYGALSELFPTVSNFNSFLIVETDPSGAGLAACEIVTIEGQGSRAIVVSNGLTADGQAGSFYSAQAARLGGLGTALRLLNTSSGTMTVTLSVKLAGGDLAGPPKQVTLAAKAFVEIDLGEFLNLADATVGTLAVSSDGPGLIGSVLFGDPEKGYAAALPLQRETSSALVFPHVAYLKPAAGHGGIFTGLALHAPGQQGVQGQIEVLDKNGIPTGSSSFSLVPGGRLSKLISELVTLEEQAGGSVRIKTNGQPLVAQELFGDGSQKMLSAVPAFEGSGYDPLAVPVSRYLVVDQFGYLPQMEKMAVIRDPLTGFDAAESFTPGSTYALVNAHSGRRVLSKAPSPWKEGVEDKSSGDRAWWFDFSDVITVGDYYVLDVENNVRSAVFRISPDLYHEVLRHAVRMFFYQRAGFPKDAQFAGEGWADGASHVGPLQDRNCRLYSSPGDGSTEKDLLGGWYDAGDLNKYTNWTADYVIDLLRAYVQAPSAFGDDFGIPESGNGISDLIDETKWGMDWLVRMQNADGSVLSIVGESHASPPSTAKGRSAYGSANTSATLTTSAAFAYGTKIFGSLQRPELQTYAQDLLARAEKAWEWAVANPKVLFRNNDSASGTSGLGAGQQETDDYGRLVKKLEAAVYLWEMTGKAVYRDFFDGNYSQVHLLQWNFAFPFESRAQEVLLYYSALAGATPDVAARIRQVYSNAMNSADNLGSFRNNTDPYLAHMKDYTWGSNSIKCRQGGMFLALSDYGAATESQSPETSRAAARYVHYIHGLNPLGLVYLSNMYDAGAENSVNEIYHTWFANGSPKWDRVGTSTYGPPRGYLTGGPNPSYNWDGCCPSGCGSSGNNALCNSESISPPKGQPPQKSYKDFNTSWPLNSWEVTEPSCGYQVAYIRLLSRFIQ